MAPPKKVENKDNEPEVTEEDQSRICRFSWLHQNLPQLETSVQKQKDELQELKDAVDEVMLADLEVSDDAHHSDALFLPKVMVKVGDVFMDMAENTTLEYLQEQQIKLEADLDRSTTEMQSVRDEISTLKRSLYAKLGNQIQLEA